MEQKKYETAMEKWKKDLLAALTAASPTPETPITVMPQTDTISKDILAKYPQPKIPARAVDFKTGELFELLTRPIIPFAIRGVLWDQGEAYSGNMQGVGQNIMMPAIIRSWRKYWGQGDFAWIFVQKQNGGGCALNPTDPINVGAKPFEPLPKDPPAAGYQFVEGFNLTTPPNTYLSITTDLVPGVHPINKSGYATRASREALGAVYG
jgi:sialate O-acetylesterase